MFTTGLVCAVTERLRQLTEDSPKTRLWDKHQLRAAFASYSLLWFELCRLLTYRVAIQLANSMRNLASLYSKRKFIYIQLPYTMRNSALRSSVLRHYGMCVFHRLRFVDLALFSDVMARAHGSGLAEGTDIYKDPSKVYLSISILLFESDAHQRSAGLLPFYHAVYSGCLSGCILCIPRHCFCH